MSRVMNGSRLPSTVEMKLRRIRSRQAGIAAVRATAIAISVLIASMLAAMVVDWWFTLFSSTVRLVLTLASLTLTVAVSQPGSPTPRRPERLKAQKTALRPEASPPSNSGTGQEKDQPDASTQTSKDPAPSTNSQKSEQSERPDRSGPPEKSRTSDTAAASSELADDSERSGQAAQPSASSRAGKATEQSVNGSQQSAASSAESVTRTTEEPAQPNPRQTTGSIELSQTGRGGPSTPMPEVDLQRHMFFEIQRGQNTESNRIRLKITVRVAVAAEAGERRRSDTMQIREQLKLIDTQLADAESILQSIHEAPDSKRLPNQSKQINSHLMKAEKIVAELRTASNETKYEFVGLQLLDIARNHLTPARDRMFGLIQNPGSNPARPVLESLHHTSAARERLRALIQQFEAVACEKLARIRIRCSERWQSSKWVRIISNATPKCSRYVAS